MSGSDVCIRNTTIYFSKLTSEAMLVFWDWSKDTMTISQVSFCPVKTGKLKSTGTVKVIIETKFKFVIELSYGEGIDYAVFVHEKHHSKNQYLYKPFNMRIPNLMQDLKTRCSEVSL